MNNRKEDTSVNHQHDSREEGQQNNIRPNDQQLNDTNAQPMMQESEEQRTGKSNDQNDERTVQEEQRQLK